MASRLADFRFPPQIIWSEGQLYTFAATGLACTLLARPLKHQTQRTKDSPRGSLPVGHMPRCPTTAMLQFGHGEQMRQRRTHQCIVDRAVAYTAAWKPTFLHSSDYEDSDIAKTRRSSLATTVLCEQDTATASISCGSQQSLPLVWLEETRLI